jgi:uncharacterized protein (TIGR03437 family)
VPSKAPTSGGAEFEVVRRSTGQILGSYLVPMNVVSPGLFMKSGTQVAALNENNTVNSATNPAATGSLVRRPMANPLKGRCLRRSGRAW